MKPKQPTLLLHPAFLLSIFLLLLNDFYLKHTYNNWITGKLSDFAGLFAFGVFLAAIFNKQKKTAIIIATGLFFIWWKSTLSSSTILFFNTQLRVPVGRVIDYSDYIALSILPLIYFIRPINFASPCLQKTMIYISCLVSFFAFTATSLPRYLTSDNKIRVEKNIYTKKEEQEIIEALKENGLQPRKENAIYDKKWSSDFYTPYKTKNGDSIMMPIDSVVSGVYSKIGYGSPYTIPKMLVGKDSVFNIQLIITEQYNRKKRIVEIYTFESHHPNDSSGYYSEYSLLRRVKKRLIKKLKSIIKD